MKNTFSPGSVIFLILVLMGVAANTVHSNPLLFLAGVLFCPLLWNLAAPWFVLRKVKVKRNIPEFAFAKEEVPCEVELISRSGAGFSCCSVDPFPGIRVIYRLLKVREFRSQKSETCRLLHYSLEFRQRGVYELSEFQMSCSYPFGMFSFVRRFRENDVTAAERQKITVFPERVNVDELWEQLTSPAFISGNRNGEGEFAGLKVWTEGDVLRDIHWRASARHGKLLTAKYETVKSLSVFVIVDLTDTDCRNAEKNVSLAGSIVHELCDRFVPQTLGAPAVIWVRLITRDGIELIKSEESGDFCLHVLKKLAEAEPRDPSLGKVSSEDIAEQFREEYPGGSVFLIGSES